MFGKRLGAACLALALSVCMLPAAAFANSTSGNLSAGQSVEIQNVASNNSKAHKAYQAKLASFSSSEFFGEYKYRDVTGDGVDELFIGWWPSIYTYANGKVKQLFSGDTGSSTFRVFGKKSVFATVQADHMGSFVYTYYKWSGKKFVKVAHMYTPTSDGVDALGAYPSYWVKGKGDVSKVKAAKYVKKITGGKKETKLAYERY